VRSDFKLNYFLLKNAENNVTISKLLNKRNPDLVASNGVDPSLSHFLFEQTNSNFKYDMNENAERLLEAKVKTKNMASPKIEENFDINKVPRSIYISSNVEERSLEVVRNKMRSNGFKH
jgi:hypothetical protein